MSFSFKQFNSIFENSAAPHIVMTLQQVISAGKVTNTVQSVIMSQLLGALSHNNVAAVRNLNEYSASSSSDIKQLPPIEQVNLATELLSIIQTGYQISASCSDPTSSDAAWVNRVLQHQK